MAAKSRRQRLEEMLALDPNDAFLRYGLAMDYAGGGDDESAAKQFAELLRTAPDYVPGYLQAGQVLARLGRDDEARSGLPGRRRRGAEGRRRPRRGGIAGVFGHADVKARLQARSASEGSPLVPKLCLGTRVGEALLRVPSRNRTRSRASRQAFPSRAWERGGSASEGLDGILRLRFRLVSLRALTPAP